MWNNCFDHSGFDDFHSLTLETRDGVLLPVSTSARTSLIKGGSSKGAGRGVLREFEGEEEEITARPSAAVGVEVEVEEESGDGCQSGFEGSRKGKSSRDVVEPCRKGRENQRSGEKSNRSCCLLRDSLAFDLRLLL